MEPEVQKALDGLNEAEAALEGRLRSLPLYQELEAVRDAKKRLAASANDASVFLGTASVAQAIRAKKENKSEHYRSLALELCQATAKRVSSRAVVNLMIQRGVPVVDPDQTMRAVSSALSSDARLDNASDSYGSGYGLKEWSAYQPTALTVPAPPTAMSLATANRALLEEKKEDGADEEHPQDRQEEIAA